jgi:hypothetical protein
MRPRDLDAELGWRDVDEGDLDAILMWHFERSRWETGERSVDYFRGGEHVLTVRFRSQDHVPATMEPGPALSAEDVARLAARFAKTGEVTDIRIYRRLLYSNVFARGSWRYSGALGRLQLLPPPPMAPDVESVLGDHPLVLEYEVALCGDDQVDRARVDRWYRKYALALSGLVTYIAVPDRQRQLWVSVLNFEAPSEGRAIWAEAVYWTMGLPEAQAVPGRRADFSPLDGIEQLAVLPHDEFHSRRGMGPEDEHLVLPETLADSLDRLAALSPRRQDQFLRAAYWLNHARRVWEMSYSASYIAVAQAIEALLPEASTVRCDVCGSAREEPSIGARFMSWVDANAPGEEPRKSLYPLRSGLVHGSALLAHDVGVHGLQPRSATEMESGGLAMRAARVGLTNWLRSQVP